MIVQTSKMLLLCLLLVSCVAAQNRKDEKVWQLNSLTSVNSHVPEISGAPKVIELAKGGKAIAFDGKNDGLLINSNPLAGAEAFSIEVNFKPYASGPENTEQRFLHIQDPGNPDRRILIELRLNGKGEWYADFFMRTEKESLTLIDSTKTHPVNEWATITLVYKNKQMRGYVNGIEETAGTIAYLANQPFS